MNATGCRDFESCYSLGDGEVAPWIALGVHLATVFVFCPGYAMWALQRERDRPRRLRALRPGRIALLLVLTLLLSFVGLLFAIALVESDYRTASGRLEEFPHEPEPDKEAVEEKTMAQV